MKVQTDLHACLLTGISADRFVIMTALQGRYRLGVRTEDSQSSNTGSIPVSATSFSRQLSSPGIGNFDGDGMPDVLEINDEVNSSSIISCLVMEWDRRGSHRSCCQL